MRQPCPSGIFLGANSQARPGQLAGLQGRLCSARKEALRITSQAPKGPGAAPSPCLRGGRGSARLPLFSKLHGHRPTVAHSRCATVVAVHPQRPNDLGIAFSTFQVKKTRPRESRTRVWDSGGARLTLPGTPGFRKWLVWCWCWAWPGLRDARA